MNKLKQVWSNLRSSFWLMPSLIVVISVAFAAVLIAADSAADDRWLARWPRLFGAGPEGARQMLSTLAGSMMSVMGITYQTLRSLDERTWRTVRTEVTGYIQSVDNDALLRLARDRKTIVRMERGIGVMARTLGALETLAGLTARPRRRMALREQARWIAELAERTIESAHDRARIERWLTQVREALEDRTCPEAP